MMNRSSRWWTPVCWNPRVVNRVTGVSAVPACTRARRALRLQRDLEIDLTGAALAVELLDEIESLRTRLRAVGGEY